MTLKDRLAKTLKSSGCSLLDGEGGVWLVTVVERSITDARSDTKGFRKTTRSKDGSGKLPSTLESPSPLSALLPDGDTSLNSPLFP